MTFTTTEHVVETTVRVRFDSPFRTGSAEYGGEYEVVTATATSSTYLVNVDHHPDEGDMNEPYVDVSFHGYRLTAKGKRDARQDRATYVPTSLVPEDITNSVKALVDTGSRVG